MIATHQKEFRNSRAVFLMNCGYHFKLIGFRAISMKPAHLLHLTVINEAIQSPGSMAGKGGCTDLNKVASLVDHDPI